MRAAVAAHVAGFFELRWKYRVSIVIASLLRSPVRWVAVAFRSGRCCGGLPVGPHVCTQVLHLVLRGT